MNAIFQKIPGARWFLFAFFFLAATSLIFEFWYSQRYYPGITIAGQSVAGKTYQESLQEFTIKYDALRKDGLTLVFKKEKIKKEIRIPAAVTGLTSDALVEYFSVGDLEKIASDAFDWGHKGTFLQRFKEQLALLRGKDFGAPISAHKEAIQSLLSRETKDFFTVKVPARFAFDNNNKVIIILEKSGDNITIEKVINTIGERLIAGNVDPIIFDLQSETPFITAKKLEPFLDLAKKIAAVANIKFYYQRRQWNVQGKTLVTWLTIKPDDQITIDSKKIEAFLSLSVGPVINDPPQNSRFEMKSGVLVEISPGKSGNAVDIKKTAALVEKIIYRIQQSLTADDPEIIVNPKDNTFEVPVKTVVQEASITKKTIDQYHIKDLVGRARTNFSGGSQDRQNNIEVGVSKITGILIAPGQEFSTVEAIGKVTEEAGFVKEFVIKDGQTIKELGGGLCQLATTLFRTALDAGLPITERINHAYVIPYYGPGLDATIYGPHPDFRFVNDTANYILLQGTAKNNEVIFELYGALDGRAAKVSLPVLSNEKPVTEDRMIFDQSILAGQVKCAAITHKGITADTTYTVRYLDGSVKEKIFHSVYEPWPKVCLVGTAIPLP